MPQRLAQNTRASGGSCGETGTTRLLSGRRRRAMHLVTQHQDLDVLGLAAWGLTDYGSVREVDERTDVLTTPVGPLLSDNSRLGGLATSFFLTASGRILVDRVGNLMLSAPGRLLVAARSTGSFYGRRMVRGAHLRHRPSSAGGCGLGG